MYKEYSSPVQEDSVHTEEVEEEEEIDSTTTPIDEKEESIDASIEEEGCEGERQ